MELKEISGGVCAAKGFKASGMHTGLSKNPSKNDVGLIFCEKKCSAAAVYTQNKVKGSPIIVTQKNISDGEAQAVIVNSTNANTCNADGEEKAVKMCELTANALGIKKEDVIVASTGVIGQPLNIKPIEDNIGNLAKLLTLDGSDECAKAIMTTDTRKKEIAVEFVVDGKICRLGGIAKGSGMIHPNMATMLCFMTTDVNISKEMLWRVLSEVTKTTFNRVSVDGDTSTNDMACVLSSGMAENSEIISVNDNYKIFKNALFEVMRYLSKEIARDGEGASKLLECVCLNAPDETTAEIVAKSVITSSLFKAAMFGEDANWGRVLCAIGYAPAEFDINLVDVSLSSKAGTIDVCKDGSGLDFSEETAKTILGEDEIRIIVNLKSGSETAEAWGCDLTYDYVKINGDYRS
ncbi:MAG TPA: bifunctional ornithine acetyltransferase/N-acetylglutamate synthase [Oscillospiraceae bacterium]|nr:bifunctional ornithine acetyltransferase/N-acetylglutamate synthase [Oscillospiraceae bacterium]